MNGLEERQHDDASRRGENHSSRRAELTGLIVKTDKPA
jgi:hypothetical protein